MPGGYGPPPKKKSKLGLIIGLGCGCFVLLGCVVGMAVGLGGLGSLMGPGEEVTSTSVALGQPFTVSYTQSGSQRYMVWLDVDVEYSQGYHLTGNAILSENGQPFGQYTIDDDGDGNAVPERSSSTRAPWSTTNVNGSGSASGNVSLFPIPARTDGSTVTISGTISGTPGTSGPVRVLVAERD